MKRSIIILLFLISFQLCSGQIGMYNTPSTLTDTSQGRNVTLGITNSFVTANGGQNALYIWNDTSTALHDGLNFIKFPWVDTGRWVKIKFGFGSIKGLTDSLATKASISSVQALSNAINSFSVPAQSWASIIGKPSFASVATTGDYNSLVNKPSLPLKQPKAYRAATNSSGVINVVYSSAYSTVPAVIPSFITNDPRDIAMVTASTVNGFTVQVQRRVDVLGLLPSYINRTGITVDIIVLEP